MKKIMLCSCLFLVFITGVKANTRVQVTLTKCVDGDTTHFLVDGEDITVRYLAIDTPEYTKEKEPYGKEASDYVCNILTNANQIELEYDDGSDALDKYGRTLAWVYADGKRIQNELVKEGFAEVAYIYGDYAYTEELKQAEKQAKQEKRNMWGTTDQEEDERTMMVRIIEGGILILIGVFFAKGKRNKKTLIKKGIRQIKRK